jgi:hypothetical protein
LSDDRRVIGRERLSNAHRICEGDQEQLIVGAEAANEALDGVDCGLHLASHVDSDIQQDGDAQRGVRAMAEVRNRSKDTVFVDKKVLGLQVIDGPTL